jgi:hypothetical protein
MSFSIRRVEYYYVHVQDRPGEAYALLSQLAASEVNLLAFGAMPTGENHAQLTLFPEDVSQLARVAERAGLVLEGPQCAILVRGDDRLGALADVHARLTEADINVYASTGVTDGRGAYGYILYVSPDQIDQATGALGA